MTLLKTTKKKKEQIMNNHYFVATLERDRRSEKLMASSEQIVDDSCVHTIYATSELHKKLSACNTTWLRGHPVK